MDVTTNIRQPPPDAIRSAMNNDSEIQIFESWKNHVGKDLHPTFGEKTQYNSQRAIWRRPLTQELETVLASSQQLDPNFDIKGCTWEDLLNHINTAICLDEEKGKNSKIRGSIRNAKADLVFLNSLTSLIPDEKGLSVLRGGLSIIFKSWSQHIETRERVLDMLKNIVELFASAASQRRFFAADEELKTLLFDLYGVMLGAVRELINLLLRTHNGNCKIARILELKFITD
ncbi:hypothetical protein N0V90_003424 [Kalmusia sp. IMI 367209]|nr:hypothetical protein N0V90_003424 [Kalmusia sp. IMI 367209]